MIGDSYHRDIIPAKEAGIKNLVHITREQLTQDKESQESQKSQESQESQSRLNPNFYYDDQHPSIIKVPKLNDELLDYLRTNIAV